MVRISSKGCGGAAIPSAMFLKPGCCDCFSAIFLEVFASMGTEAKKGESGAGLSSLFDSDHSGWVTMVSYISLRFETPHIGGFDSGPGQIQSRIAATAFTFGPIRVPKLS